MRIIILFFAALFLLASCKQEAAVKVESDSYFTCSMHPQVVSDKPGKCPICHMQLINVKKTGTLRDGEVKLSDEQIMLGNIKTDTLRTGAIGQSITLTATLVVNQNTTSSVSARVGGRIERLYFKEIGEFIHTGDPIFDLYSEELNTAKQEYLLTLKQAKMAPEGAMINYHQLAESAKNRLVLWGMTAAQITTLGKAGIQSTVTTILSNRNGYITSIAPNEGEYVMEGSPVFQLADLSSVWAEAQAYASQLSDIDKKGTATVKFPELGNQTFIGQIEFVNPAIDPGTHTNIIRIKVPNTTGRLRPGMIAYVMLKSNPHKTLSLPIDAVIRDSRGASVWVQTVKNTFAIRMVSIGLETDDVIEISDGLKDGDVVVTSGAYLLNSEFIFKNGADPMAGMNM